MEAWLRSSIYWLLSALALPEVGLSAIFIVSLVSATILPLGSEPAVFGYIKLSPHMFWPAVLVATLGNTLGGIISYAMGLGAEKGYERWREKHGHLDVEAQRRKSAGRWHKQMGEWVDRFGPSALFFSWLPIIGDPLCVVAGWFKLPFWPSVFFMALGKFLRYVVMTLVLLWLFPETIQG